MQSNRSAHADTTIDSAECAKMTTAEIDSEMDGEITYEVTNGTDAEAPYTSSYGYIILQQRLVREQLH